MSELLQEFVDSSRQNLRVDRDAGVIRGVQFRHGEGLFGDLHFNPRHALSEQLVWDAEHAPQNVGMSHNVLARTKQVGDETIVEAITKVQSIDLVADPATTSGLYEHTTATSPHSNANSETQAAGTSQIAIDALTLEHLRSHRPDLVREIEAFRSEELRAVQQQLDEALLRESTMQRRELVIQLLEEHNLPLPKPEAPDSQPVSSRFIETLMQAGTVEMVRQLIEERAALVRSAGNWTSQYRTAARPRSRDQLEFAFMTTSDAPKSGSEFAATLRRA